MISFEEYLFLEKGQNYDANLLLHLAKQVGQMFQGQKIGMAYSMHPLSKAVYHLFSGTILAEGTDVWCFGESFLSALRFYTSFCHFALGIFIEEVEGKVKLYFCNTHGILWRPQETKRLLSKPAVPKKTKACGELSMMRNLEGMYLQKIVSCVAQPLLHQEVLVQSKNPLIQNFFADCLYRAKASKGDTLTFRMDENGLKLSIFHRDCGWIPYPKILALAYYLELEQGKDISFPYDAPYLIDTFPKKDGQKIERLFEGEAVSIADANWYAQDALLLGMKILNTLECEKTSLPCLLEKLPAFYDQEKQIRLKKPWQNLKSRFSKNILRSYPNLLLLEYPKGHALLEYQTIGKDVRVLTESSSYEFSKELLETIKETLLKD